MKRVIIDLQSKNDYNVNHIKGAINIPYSELLYNYRKYLNKNDLYILYCKKGRLSLKMKTMLSYLGYNVVDYKN